MKRIYILVALMSFGYMGVLICCYPELMGMLEGNDMFLSTSDFFLNKMASPPGINEWLVSFILQFFRFPIMGGIIEALLLSGIALLSLALSKAAGNKYYLEVSFVPSIVLCVVFPLVISLQLEAIFLLGSICIYLRIRRWIWRIVFGMTFALFGFFIMSFPTIFMGLLLFALAEWRLYHTALKSVIPVSFIIIDIALVQLTNIYFGFVPFNERYFKVNAITETYQEVIFLLTFFLLVVVSYSLSFVKKKMINQKALFVLGVFATITGLCILSQDKKMLYNENCYHYICLAEKNEWNDLLQEIQYDEEIDADFKLKYSLLAESALGTLPDHLFQYPINNPEHFLYRHQRDFISCIFNRLFYANIGIFDEAIHNAFEYAMQQPYGMCFSSLRQITEYSIKTEDFQVAEKYLDILGKSTLHDSFVESKKKEMENQLKKKEKSDIPLRGDNFVGGYPFNSEFIRLLQIFPENKKILDYLLCGLLLQKNLVNFRLILRGFPLYKNKDLPQAYAEASAMIEAEGGSIRDMFNYNTNYDKSFQSFYTTYQGNDMNALSAYTNSYWKYFFCTPLPNETSTEVAEDH